MTYNFRLWNTASFQEPISLKSSVWNLQSGETHFLSRCDAQMAPECVAGILPRHLWASKVSARGKEQRLRSGIEEFTVVQHLLQMTALLLSPCKCSRDSYVNICYHGNQAARLIRSTHTNEVWSLEMWSGKSPICRRTQPEPWSPLCCFTGSDSTTIVSCLHILAHTLDTRWEQPKPEALPKTRQMQIINRLITC